MGIVNFGIVKAIVSTKFKDTLVESNNSSFKKKKINEFVEILKSSKLLETEFTVYSNLESKTITNPNLAIKYIDECISLMKKFDKNQFITEHKKLEKFTDKNIDYLEAEKVSIYENIHNLIYETLNGDTIPNVDTIHESFSIILDHISKEKTETVNESTFSLDGIDGDQVIESAINKFNEKFATLSESEQKLLKSLVFSSDNEKNTLFESLKENGLSKLNQLKSKTMYDDKTNESIAKISNMKFNKETIVEDVIKLNVLNSL